MRRLLCCGSREQAGVPEINRARHERCERRAEHCKRHPREVLESLVEETARTFESRPERGDYYEVSTGSGSDRVNKFFALDVIQQAFVSLNRSPTELQPELLGSAIMNRVLRFSK